MSYTRRRFSKKPREDISTHDAAVYYAGNRARTSGEVIKYLTERDYPMDEIEESIERLKEIYMLDDDEYARSMVSSRLLLKPTSRRKLESMLKEHLLDDNTIADTLIDYTDDTELENALAFAKRTCMMCHYVPDECGDTDEDGAMKCRQKLIRRLLYNGFGYETTKTAVTRYCRQRGTVEFEY